MTTPLVVGILFVIVFFILIFKIAKNKENYEKMTPEEKIAHNTKTLATIELLRLADRD